MFGGLVQMSEQDLLRKVLFVGQERRQDFCGGLPHFL